MGIINVQTDDGIKRVQIEGDKPTDEEQEFILNTFFADEAPQFDPSQPSRPASPNINLATASPEEIENYRRQLELAGIHQKKQNILQEK